MAGTDARCKGDVRKLALFFEKLGASSPPDTKKSSEIINRKGCGGSSGSGYTPVVFMGQNDFGGPVARGGASVDKRQCVPCNECSKSHPLYSDCPYTPCDICDKVYDSARCPYFDHLPQGATFPPGYEIVCRCGNLFNEDKWACSYCGGSMPAVLKAKFCSICNIGYQHSVYECPKDIALAAKYKSVRDNMLSRVPIPYRPVYPESSSGIPYVPTTPSLSVCGDMKEGKDPVYIPESSSGTTYSPTAPSWVCGDMKEGKDPVYIPESSSGMTYSPTAPSWVCGDIKEGKDMNIGTPCWKPTSWTQ